MTRLAHWRAGVLGGVVIACGLVLNLTLLGANPVVQLAAVSPAPAENAVAETLPLPPTTPAVVDLPIATQPVESAPATTPQTEQADQTQALAAAIAVPASPSAVQPAAAPQAPSAPLPSATPVPAPAQAPTPAAAPAAAAPAPAAPAPAAPTTTPSTTRPPTTSPAATAAPTTAAPTTAAPTTAPPTTAAPTTVAPLIEYLDYTVDGGVGRIVLARQGNDISLYGFYPNSGWVHEVERDGPLLVKLKFFNVQTGNDREWKAEVEGGRINVEN